MVLELCHPERAVPLFVVPSKRSHHSVIPSEQSHHSVIPSERSPHSVIPSEPGESRDPLKSENVPYSSLSGFRGSFDSLRPFGPPFAQDDSKSGRLAQDDSRVS